MALHHRDSVWRNKVQLFRNQRPTLTVNGVGVFALGIACAREKAPAFAESIFGAGSARWTTVWSRDSNRFHVVEKLRAFEQGFECSSRSLEHLLPRFFALRDRIKFFFDAPGVIDFDKVC